MRQVIVLLLSLLPVFATGSESQKTQVGLTAIAKMATPSVYLLTVYDENNKAIRTATGFIITNDGMLCTNHHVIIGAKRIDAKAFNGGIFNVIGVLADDPENDLALLKIDGNSFKPLLLEKKQIIEVGQRILVIGSPRGLQGTLTDGIISAIRDINGKTGRTIQMTAAISPGSSGSPVLNLNGKVIGIATSQIQNGQTLNFAMTSSKLELLFSNIKSNTIKSLIELKSIQINPDEILNDPEFFECGILINKNQLSDALIIGEKLLIRYPNDYRPLQFMGRTNYLLHIYNEAIKNLQQSLKLKSYSAETWCYLGTVYDSIGQDNDSIKAYEQSSILDPTYNHGICLKIVGTHLSRIGNKQEAIVYLKKALTIIEGKELDEDMILFYVIGSCYCDLRKFQEADEIYMKLLHFPGKQAKSMANMLQDYIRVKKY